MRIAVLSDVHANSFALEAVLTHIGTQSVDLTLNLGDVVSGPIDPAATANLLTPLNLPTILGNHEDNLLTRDASRLSKADRFARQQLSKSQFDWLKTFSPTWQSDDGEIFACHGTPASNRTYWLDAPDPTLGVMSLRQRHDIAADIGAITARVLLCGHSHVQRAVTLDDGRLIVNPGSVGLVTFRDSQPGLRVSPGTPHAQYATLTQSLHGWDVSFHRIGYDWVAAANTAERNGAPDWARWICGD